MKTLTELESRLEVTTISTVERRTIELLLAAVRDWPEEVKSAEEFVALVELKVGGVVSLARLVRAMRRLDLSKEAWIAESMSSLQELLELHSGYALRRIIDKL